jgi:preprotein translocase subunit SecE
MAKDQAPSAPLSGRAGRNIGRGPKGKPPARAGGGQSSVEASPPKPRTNPVEFFRQVRAEARKTTWTSPKETWITSVMVLIMVVVATLFFFGVDFAVSWIVQQLIKIGA